jgi:hypothetical protein
MDLHHLLLAGLPAHSGLPNERTNSEPVAKSQTCQMRSIAHFHLSQIQIAWGKIRIPEN